MKHESTGFELIGHSLFGLGGVRVYVSVSVRFPTFTSSNSILRNVSHDSA